MNYKLQRRVNAESVETPCAGNCYPCAFFQVFGHVALHNAPERIAYPNGIESGHANEHGDECDGVDFGGHAENQKSANAKQGACPCQVLLACSDALHNASDKTKNCGEKKAHYGYNGPYLESCEVEVHYEVSSL